MDQKNGLKKHASAASERGSRRFLKIGQVAELLNCSVPTLRYWVFRGKIPFIKIGRSIRFDEQEIFKWLELNSRGIDL